MTRIPAFAAAALCLAASACAVPVVPAVAVVEAPANPFPVATSAAQAGSRIYDSLRACGQPGVDLTIGQIDQITTSSIAGPFAGLRVLVQPAYPDALVTVQYPLVTPALLARVQGWAVRGPDC